MKTKYVVTKLLGSQTFTNSMDEANKTFDTCLDAVTLTKDGAQLRRRDHKFMGYIPQIKKGMPNIKVYRCYDNGKIITRTGALV